MTENISVPGSQSGHDVLGGLVPIETEHSVPVPPPASSKAPSAADQFATLAFELAERIEGVAMRINQGSLPLDGAITAIEVLFAKFPADVHRLAEAVKNDAIRS